MESTTVMFGKILGLYLLTSGVAFIVATPFYAELTRKADRSDPMAVNISGMVHLFVGFGVVVNHFRWDGLLPTLVTLLGVAFVVRGLAYYWIPHVVLRPAEARATGLRVMGAAFVVVGGLTGYLSFLG
ncbi:hypothetical protein [Mycobacterium spongiae]|uniref:Uncharacterized protein n=1 Tax=Mycobacterium spongiae TaxID=886343 RepID=A0A975JZR6_9MYCO|nr:hypothetical protein [Mycobacterium spongiae]QUR68388.1 hypothetical protein F6B93_16050 [Mycobacterium spongiae]